MFYGQPVRRQDGRISYGLHPQRQLKLSERIEADLYQTFSTSSNQLIARFQPIILACGSCTASSHPSLPPKMQVIKSVTAASG